MLLAQSRGRAGASRPRPPVRFPHSSAAPTAPPQGSSKAASQMGSHSTSGRTEGTESASPSPSPRRSPHHSARSPRAGGTDTFPRTVSTQKVPQVDPSPPIHIGKFAPLPLPKIPTKSETFDPPHFRPADGRPTPLQPFRLRLQGFRSVGLPSAAPHAQGGPRPHTSTNHLELNHTRSTAIIPARHNMGTGGWTCLREDAMKWWRTIRDAAHRLWKS